MNLLDAYVINVLSEPRFNDSYKNKGVTWWEVDVEYDCWGSKGKRTLSFKTEAEARRVKEGYKFPT